MTADSSTPPPSLDSPCEPPAADQAGLLQSAQAVWQGLRWQAHDQLQLLGLEAQRAGESIVGMLALGFVASVLVLIAWLGGAAALVLGMMGNGVTLSAALGIATLITLLGAFGFALSVRRLSHALQFPSTLRSLQPADRKSDTQEDA